MSRRATSAFCLLLSALIGCHRETRDITPTIVSASNPYEGNAYAISEGQRLYEQYNCSGCHFHGGGGIGPAFMDADWIYGSSPANIYISIAEGRPNGMPSFGRRVPAYQIWELTTYVRALGGLEPQIAVSPRADQMMTRRAEEPKQ